MGSRVHDSDPGYLVQVAMWTFERRLQRATALAAYKQPRKPGAPGANVHCLVATTRIAQFVDMAAPVVKLMDAAPYVVTTGP